MKFRHYSGAKWGGSNGDITLVLDLDNDGRVEATFIDREVSKFQEDLGYVDFDGRASW